MKCLTPTRMHRLTTLIATESPRISTHQKQLGRDRAHAMSYHTQLRNAVDLCCFHSLIVLKSYTENQLAQ